MKMNSIDLDSIELEDFFVIVEDSKWFFNFLIDIK